MNINALRDSEASKVGVYVAACGNLASGWPGCVIYRSKDNGGSYSPIGFLDTPAIVGTCWTNPAAPLHGTAHDGIDWKNYLEVEIPRGELSSCTYSQLLNGTNWCVVNEEIMGFMEAEIQTPYNENILYHLKGLLRGRRGTEYAMTQHSSGTGRFVMLSAAAMKFIETETEDIGKTFLIKPVTRGSNLNLTASQTFTFGGATLKPYAPVEVRAIRGADGGNDILIRWVRRNRISGEWRDGVDVPMSETTESYEVDIFSTSAMTTLKRTLTSTTPEVTYTSAQQVTDFGSNQATIHVKVYQMSSIVGRGRAAAASI